MKRIHIKAILGGWLFIASSSVFFVLLIASSFIAGRDPKTIMSPTTLIVLFSQMFSARRFLNTVAAISSVVLFLGAYLTARTSGNDEIRNSIWAGLLSLPVSLTPFPAVHSTVSVWVYSGVYVAMAVGGIVLGGYVGRLVNGKRVARRLQFVQEERT